MGRGRLSSPVDRLHVERMAEHEGNLLASTEIGEPVAVGRSDSSALSSRGPGAGVHEYRALLTRPAPSSQPFALPLRIKPTTLVAPQKRKSRKSCIG